MPTVKRPGNAFLSTTAGDNSRFPSVAYDRKGAQASIWRRDAVNLMPGPMLKQVVMAAVAHR